MPVSPDDTRALVKRTSTPRASKASTEGDPLIHRGGPERFDLCHWKESDMEPDMRVVVKGRHRTIVRIDNESRKIVVDEIEIGTTEVHGVHRWRLVLAALATIGVLAAAAYVVRMGTLPGSMLGN